MVQAVHPGAGCCPIPSAPTRSGWHLRCASSPRAAQAAPLHGIQSRIWAGQLLTQCSAPAAQSQHSVPTITWGWDKPSLQPPRVPRSSTHTPTDVAAWGGTGSRVPSASKGIGHPGWHRGLQVQGTCCPRLREGLSSSKPRVEFGSQQPLPAAALPGGWSPRAQGHGVAGAGPRRDWEAALHSPAGKWALTRAGSVSLQSYDSAGSRACCASHRPPDGPEG